MYKRASEVNIISPVSKYLDPFQLTFWVGRKSKANFLNFPFTF